MMPIDVRRFGAAITLLSASLAGCSGSAPSANPEPPTGSSSAALSPIPKGGNIASFMQNDGIVRAIMFDSDGKLRALKGLTYSGPWSNSFISSSVLAPAGAPLIVQPEPGDLLYGFFVGNNGAVYKTWMQSNGAWHAPDMITSTGVAGAGAALAAGHRGAELDLFFVDEFGYINRIWVSDATDTAATWSGPIEISNNEFQPKGRIATVRQTATQLDVFSVDIHGHVTVNWAQDSDNWSGVLAGKRSTISGTVTFPPGGVIGAGWQTSTQLDLLGVDDNGSLDVMWVVGTGTWQGPSLIHDYAEEVYIPGGGLKVIQEDGNVLGVILTTWVGNVEHYWVDGANPWEYDLTISPGHFSPPGAPISGGRNGAGYYPSFFFTASNDGVMNAYSYSSLWGTANSSIVF